MLHRGARNDCIFYKTNGSGLFQSDNIRVTFPHAIVIVQYTWQCTVAAGLASYLAITHSPIYLSLYSRDQRKPAFRYTIS